MIPPVFVAGCRFVADASASAAVRRFVAAYLDQMGMVARAPDVALVVTELSTNVVLHARTDFEVRLLRLDGGVRIEVEDRSESLPMPGTLSLTAMSGRGLTLVQAVAARCGVERVPDAGKVIWCEICAIEEPPATSLSVDDLLALWTDDEPDPDGLAWLPRQRYCPPDDDLRTILVPELPTAQLIAAKVHMEDLLRELQLVLIQYTSSSDSKSPTVPDAIRLARRLVATAEEFGEGIRQVRAQALMAAESGQPQVTLRLQLPAKALSAAVHYRDAITEAAELPANRYLTDPRSQDATIRARYLNSVIDQLRTT